MKPIWTKIGHKPSNEAHLDQTGLNRGTFGKFRAQQVGQRTRHWAGGLARRCGCSHSPPPPCRNKCRCGCGESVRPAGAQSNIGVGAWNRFPPKIYINQIYLINISIKSNGQGSEFPKTPPPPAILAREWSLWRSERLGFGVRLIIYSHLMSEIEVSYGEK